MSAGGGGGFIRVKNVFACTELWVDYHFLDNRSRSERN
jgi:hypothetical protein